MTGTEWFIVFMFSFGVLAYHRASLVVWTLSFFLLTVFLSVFHSVASGWIIATWIVLTPIFAILNFFPLRRTLLTQHILTFYRRVMPTMSRTEKEALAAGTVTWEGDLFCGAPDWQKLLNLPQAKLSIEEQAFLDGPVEKLCSMLDDWDITHTRADLSPAVWQFLKDNGFFSLIIPKEYGGKQFSAYAHSQILTKVYGVSSTAATTIAVPNSLGPAELLLHYGTEEQKNYYLPRLACGEDVPCFALTGPDAGSDAGAMPDTGIVCWGEHEGKKTLGILLNFNKRYITLAPVATVLGLAFKLYDPEHLIGKTENLGITCALIPRNTPNVIIGRRHLPLNIAFQNGPIKGKDVFIPIDWIIGGPKMAGQGWRMLMECLAAGRAISLPASATGGAKMLSYVTGAYARIRRQFNVPIGRFEGIEEPLARIAGGTYVIDAARTFAAAAIDAGAKPSIASAIIKFHTTELARTLGNDVMDIHGGKGICLGPKNYAGRGYQAIPIAITVEGANILTRSMIIFGQGAMRCHPYIFAEFTAANLTDETMRLPAFDKAIIGHLSFTLSNFVRALFLSFTSGRFVIAPKGKTHRYFQHVTRFSAGFALIADVSLLLLGGALKRKESISARLGDILSYLYLISATLKFYHDHDKYAAELPLVRWACENYLYQTQEKFKELLQNYPNRFVGMLLNFVLFPWGKHFEKPSDKLTHKMAQLLLAPTDLRKRLAAGIFVSQVKNNFAVIMDDALDKAIAAEPIEKTVKTALAEKRIFGKTAIEQAQSALNEKIISPEEYNTLILASEARQAVIAVDDFAPEELSREGLKSERPNSQSIPHVEGEKNTRG